MSGMPGKNPSHRRARAVKGMMASRSPGRPRREQGVEVLKQCTFQSGLAL